MQSTHVPGRRGRKPASVHAAIKENQKRIQEAESKYRIWVDASVIVNGEVIYFDDQGKRTSKPKRLKRKKTESESDSVKVIEV